RFYLWLGLRLGLWLCLLLGLGLQGGLFLRLSLGAGAYPCYRGTDLGRDALLDQDLELAIVLSLEIECGLVRLDLGQDLAFVDVVAAGLLPLDDRALLHGVGELGHVYVGHRSTPFRSVELGVFGAKSAPRSVEFGAFGAKGAEFGSGIDFSLAHSA